MINQWYHIISSFTNNLITNKMLHVNLPMRPRIKSVPFQVAITPLSIVSQISGTKIILTTSINSLNKSEDSEYLKFITKNISGFDFGYSDSDKEFLEFIKKEINQLSIYIEPKQLIKTCACGEFEELPHGRMFNQRKVQNDICTLCDSLLEEKESDCVLFNPDWNKARITAVNHPWVILDWKHFLKRQPVKYLFSKRIGKIKFVHNHKMYGIRYQYLWALLLGFIAQKHSDIDITLHYVNLVQDRVFFVASLALMMFPMIRISLHALPRVTTSNNIPIENIGPTYLKELTSVLNTKRKSIHISI